MKYIYSMLGSNLEIPLSKATKLMWNSIWGLIPEIQLPKASKLKSEKQFEKKLDKTMVVPLMPTYWRPLCQTFNLQINCPVHCDGMALYFTYYVRKEKWQSIETLHEPHQHEQHDKIKTHGWQKPTKTPYIIGEIIKSFCPLHWQSSTDNDMGI